MGPTQSTNPNQVPSKDELYVPILKVLSRVSIISMDDLVKGIIAEMKLSSSIEDTKAKGRTDKSQIKSNSEWACSQLRNRGLIDYPDHNNDNKRTTANRTITDLGRKVLEEGRDPKSMPILSKKDDTSDDLDDPLEAPFQVQFGSFFDYLSAKGLEYNTESVEDFLLSLKAKQFVILSGGTGTGKTRLAKAYGEFISPSHTNSEIKLNVKLGKQLESDRAVAISREELSKACPDAINADLQCSYKILEFEGEGVLKMFPRYTLNNDEHNNEVAKRLFDVGKEGTERTDLFLNIPDKTSSNKKYVIVPVGSNWTDNSHILGYKNAISGKYERTPSLNLIVTSDKDPLNQYMLVLDEMNLSHVERYFSDVISCMESRVPIILDTDGTVPKELSIGDNLFVVGTVNMDETTYTFSPKILDRANILEFEAQSVRGYLESVPSYNPEGDIEFLQNPQKGVECRRMNARNVIREMENAGVDTSSMKNDLESIHGIMSKMGLPFAYRTLDEVMRFMYVAWKYEGGGEFVNWKRYMDAQIRQKILPKIHGNVSIKEGLTDLRRFCDENGYSRSKKKLDRMMSVLESQRYVSFNCRPWRSKTAF